MRSYNDLDIDYQDGELDIYSMNLDSLAGCPSYITGNFNCRDNMLTSLVDGPQRVDGDYECGLNNLTDLVGCASHIGGALCFSKNNITSLVGIHKIVKSCNMFFWNSQITEGGIGLLLIENLININSIGPLVGPFKIIKSYLGSGTKGMMKCRSELIENGFTDYAKL